MSCRAVLHLLQTSTANTRSVPGPELWVPAPQVIVRARAAVTDVEPLQKYGTSRPSFASAVLAQELIER